MEQKNNLILQGTETFSRGALDNVALENGCLVLDSSAGRYLPYGSYTSPELAMPAFCNLNVSWNALAPDNTMLEVRCRVYAGGDWTNWMSFGKWAPDYPRRSVHTQTEDGRVFLMGDTVTVAAPGGGVGIQLQVNLSSNDGKVTPAVRLLAAAVRPLSWERQDGAVINRRLYLPEYSLAGHDPSFGREMDLSLVVASLMNRWGEDILPEEVAYTMFDGATNGIHNAAYAVAAAACCGYPAWQGWLDLKELRAQIHDGCSVGVEMETRLAGQKEPVRVWMALRGFGHDEEILANYVLLNDPTTGDGAVARTMPVADFQRFFTGRAIVLRPKPRGIGPSPGASPPPGPAASAAGWRTPGTENGSLPARACGSLCPRISAGGSPAPSTTGWPTPPPPTRPSAGWSGRLRAGCASPPKRPKREAGAETGGRCCVYAVDQTGKMRVAEILLPHPAGTAGAD